MLTIVLIMLVILAVAALVMTFAAYPHRGEDVPRAAWLGQALNRAADAMPTLENTDGIPEPRSGGSTGLPLRRHEGAGAPKGSARAS